MIKFVYSTGGREKYFKGKAGDCATRAICNATGMDYKEVYDGLYETAKNYGTKKTRRVLRIRAEASPRNGVFKEVMHQYLTEKLSFKWVACMGKGTGIRIHVREDERPKGTLILSLSKHFSCVKDGVLYDTYDCSRQGTRGVYGFWSKDWKSKYNN